MKFIIELNGSEKECKDKIISGVDFAFTLNEFQSNFYGDDVTFKKTEVKILKYVGSKISDDTVLLEFEFDEQFILNSEFARTDNSNRIDKVNDVVSKLKDILNKLNLTSSN